MPKEHTTLEGQFSPQPRTGIKQSLLCKQYPEGWPESVTLKIHMLPQNNWLNIRNCAEKGRDRIKLFNASVSHSPGSPQAQHARCCSSALETGCWVHQPPLGHALLFQGVSAHMGCLRPIHIDLQVGHSILKNIKWSQKEKKLLQLSLHSTCMNRAHEVLINQRIMRSNQF